MSVHSTNQAKPDQTDTRGIILTMVSSESIVEENTIVHNVFIETHMMLNTPDHAFKFMY